MIISLVVPAGADSSYFVQTCKQTNRNISREAAAAPGPFRSEGLSQRPLA